jgi:hypothetical protein
MALLHMGPTTDHPSATQESMFEEPAGYSGPDPDEIAYDASDDASEDVSEEPSYEASEEFSGEALESISSERADEPVLHSTGVTNSSEAVSQPHAHEVQPDRQPAPPPNLAAKSEPEPLTVLSVDDFAALEERVLRAVSLVRHERQARAAAEERSLALEGQLQAHLPAIDRLQQEVDSLRTEREQVRQRVERLLSQLDALEL